MLAYVRDVIFVLRPWFWLPGIASALAGCLWAGEGYLSMATFMTIAIILGPGICAFAEIVNDLSDVSLDRQGTQKSFFGLPMSGGSGVLTAGHRGTLILARFLMGLTLAVGAIGCVLLPARITPLVLGGYFLAWAYSVPPIRGKTRGLLGVLLQGCGYGPVAFYIGYSTIAAPVLDAGLPISLLIGIWTALVGITADLLDHEDDLKHGIQTLVVRLGPRRTQLMSVLGGIICIIIGVLAKSFWGEGHNAVLFAFVTAIFCVYSWRVLVTSASEIAPATHGLAILLEIIFPIALTVR